MHQNGSTLARAAAQLRWRIIRKPEKACVGTLFEFWRVFCIIVLSLARLRVRGQLTELRATDLRFTPSEAAEFFDQVMGLTIT
jgi:hypothetical protein